MESSMAEQQNLTARLVELVGKSMTVETVDGVFFPGRLTRIVWRDVFIDNELVKAADAVVLNGEEHDEIPIRIIRRIGAR